MTQQTKETHSINYDLAWQNNLVIAKPTDEFLTKLAQDTGDKDFVLESTKPKQGVYDKQNGWFIPLVDLDRRGATVDNEFGAVPSCAIYIGNASGIEPLADNQIEAGRGQQFDIGDEIPEFSASKKQVNALKESPVKFKQMLVNTLAEVQQYPEKAKYTPLEHFPKATKATQEFLKSQNLSRNEMNR